MTAHSEWELGFQLANQAVEISREHKGVFNEWKKKGSIRKLQTQDKTWAVDSKEPECG